VADRDVPGAAAGPGQHQVHAGGLEQAAAGRVGTQRFLREARRKVWANAIVLSRARRQGPDAYAAVLAQLEELSAAKVTALQAPGQVLLKLAATGFGVRLPTGA